MRRCGIARTVAAGVAAFCSIAGSAMAGLPGDVDLDCDVDVADAVLLERSLAGYVTLTDEQAANANLTPIDGEKDSLIDVADLVTIKRIVARDADPATPLSTPTIQSVTGTNPVTVSGTGAPADERVLLYVNGDRHPQNAIVDGSGNFTFSDANGFSRVPLFDGENRITVVARDTTTGSESCSSAPQTVTYTPSALSNPAPTAISGTVVWTPGAFEDQTVEVDEPLVIESGGMLFIQPGTIVKFASSAKIQVDDGGKLQIVGSAAQKVQLGPQGGGTCDGSTRWAGIVIKSAPGPRNLIEHAVIDCVTNGVTVSDGISAGPVTMQRSQVKRWSGSGVFISSNATAAAILDNEFADGPTGITSASEGTLGSLAIRLERNRIRDTQNGINVSRAPDTLEGNDIRSSFNGIRVGISTGSEILFTFDITGNTVTDNCNGVMVDWDQLALATPVIEGNSIYDNENCTCNSPTQTTCTNLTTNLVGAGYVDPPGGSVPTLDATDNWWGSTNVAEIEANIHGWGSQSAPIDFIPYLDAPFDQGGVSVGSAIQGEIHDGNKPTAGTDWIAPVRIGCRPVISAERVGTQSLSTLKLSSRRPSAASRSMRGVGAPRKAPPP